MFSTINATDKTPLEEINREKKRMWVFHHPDRYLDETEKIKHQEEFTKITIAYECIKASREVENSK